MRSARLASLALSLTLAACTGKYVRPTTPEKVVATPEATARGGYLVNQVAACGACHTPRVNLSWLEGERTDAYLGGGQVIDDAAFGMTVVMPNITVDAETGIGGWSDDQILRAVRDGVRADDQLLMPPMPFGTWAHLSDDDARAIVAYLRSVPPVRNAVDRSHNHFAFGLRFAKSMGFIHHRPAANVQAPPRADRVRYGEYLAHGVAPCHDCHSLTSKGPSDDNLFGGGETPMEEPAIGKIWARNLTPDKETGLGNYTAAQIKEALRSGKRLDGKLMAPPMSAFIPHFSGMTDDDLDAVVAYLMSLPAKKHKVPDRLLTPAAKKLVGDGI
ncbi:MAG TPA: c-type cytochrome [Polyangia bacterium]|nr:c-type cytochrome [Polyangia bacterium]